MARIDTLARLREIVGEPNPVARHKITSVLQPEAVDFIRRSPFLLLATASVDGRPDVSPKGDQPGFVIVQDEGHILVPDRPGNLGLGEDAARQIDVAVTSGYRDDL